MAFDLINFSGSAVYKSYLNVWNGPIYFETHSPFKALADIAVTLDSGNKLDWKTTGLSPVNLSTNPSGYANTLPFFYVNHGCLDNISDINNKNKSKSELKVPITYFSNGKMFGLETILNFIRDGKEIVQDETKWNFYKDVDKFGALTSNDVNSALDAIFYYTYYQYFILNFFQVKLAILLNKKYSTPGFIFVADEKKGQVVDGIKYENGYNIYNKGAGEAPNFLNVTVDSYQKIKNKVLFGINPITTDYISSDLAEKQIIFKDNRNELLSAFAIDQVKEVFLSSISDDEVKKVINTYIKSIMYHFNLIHIILKSSIFNYLFFDKYLVNYEDIFSFKDPDNNQSRINIYNTFANSKSFKEQEQIKYISTSTRELMINLLNLVGDDQSIETIINTLIDFMESNESVLIGNYDRESFKKLLKEIHSIIYLDFSKTNQPSPNQVLNLRNYTINSNVIHSHDVILQKIYVYRTLERPTTFSDILQENNFYKVYDYKNGFSIIDNIDINTKYYYCFLSQREYDVCKEVFNRKDVSRIVQHFSSPTKILELEMISTENSTYLDYNFFQPEQEIFQRKIKNFLSKIKFGPSDEQKKLYNPDKRDFDIPDGLLSFWTKTEKEIASYDKDTGLTLKLRLASPKTKKKIDINVRHFINDQYNFGGINKSVTIDDILAFANGKKFDKNGVSSNLVPEVDLSFYKEPSSTLDGSDIPKLQKFTQPLDLKIIKTNSGNYFIANLPSIFFIPTVKNGFTSFVKNLFFKSRIEFYKSTDLPNKPTEVLIIQEQGPDLKTDGTVDLYNPISNIPLDGFFNGVVKFPYTKAVIIQEIQDNAYGFTYKNSLESKILDATPSYNITVTDSIDEGGKFSFLLNTKNVDDKTVLYWNLLPKTVINNSLQPANNDFPKLGSFSEIPSGTVTINKNAAISELIEVVSDQLTEGVEKFIVQVFTSSDKNPQSLVLESNLITINDTSKTREYSIITGKDEINEGEAIQIFVETKNVPDGTTLKWDVILKGMAGAVFTPVDKTDFNPQNVFNGTFSVSKNLTPILTFNSLEDYITEGNEYLVFRIFDSKDNFIQSKNIKINDTSKDLLTDIPFGQLGSFINPFLTFEDFQKQEQILAKQYNNIYYIDSTTRNLKKAIYNKGVWTGKTDDLGSSGILGSKTNPFASYNEWFNSTDKLKYEDSYYVNTAQPNPDYKLILAKTDQKNNYISPTTRNKNYTPDQGVYLPAKPVGNKPLRPTDGKNLNLTDPSLKSWQAIVVGSLPGQPVYFYDQNKNIYPRAYTSDSNWAAAAVHAGLIKVGEKAIIVFEYVGSVKPFSANTNNGVTSTPYGNNWDTYNISLVRKLPK